MSMLPIFSSYIIFFAASNRFICMFFHRDFDLWWLRSTQFAYDCGHMTQLLITWLATITWLSLFWCGRWTVVTWTMSWSRVSHVTSTFSWFSFNNIFNKSYIDWCDDVVLVSELNKEIKHWPSPNKKSLYWPLFRDICGPAIQFQNF